MDVTDDAQYGAEIVRDLRAQVARLGGELATSRAETKELAEKGYEASVWGWSKERNRIVDQLFKVRGEKAAMAAALRPFAAILHPSMEANAHLGDVTPMWGYGDLVLTLGDLKAARAALSGEGKVWEQVEKALERILEASTTPYVADKTSIAHTTRAALAAMRGE